MTTILQNLQILRKTVESEPTELFNLSFYRYTEPCGTLHCTLGLAVEKGIVPENAARWATDFSSIALNMSTIELDKFYGRDSYNRLFDSRYSGTFDDLILKKILKTHPDLFSTSDREFALARIDHQIAIYTKEENK